MSKSDLNIFRTLFQIGAILYVSYYLNLAVKIYCAAPGKEGFFIAFDIFLAGFIPAIILLAIGEIFKSVKNIEDKKCD
jgi:hypothetical protein